MRKEDPQNAMNPSDGILLCKLCDIAFERGDISLQENLQIVISEKLKNSKNNTVKSWLSEIHNIIPINSESKFKPHLKFIQRKLELVQKT
jgi:predicted restriction endonuclease